MLLNRFKGEGDMVMERMKSVRVGRMLVAVLACVMVARAQAPAASAIVTTPDMANFDALVVQGKALLEKARAGSGSASVMLSEYGTTHTMLSARTKSGGAEFHARRDDFLIVIDGEGTELTGGTMVDRKEKDNGEAGGTRLEGATAHVLHKGDVLHIPAGTPHQAIEALGQTITIFVIKVQAGKL